MDDPKMSDLTLKVGLEGVMDRFEFVEANSNRIRCAHCKEVTVFYYAGECEHKPTICSICYENLGIKTCPDCEQAIEDVCREDSQFLDSNVYCPLRKDGCEVIFPLRNALEHRNECHPSVDLTKQATNTKSKRIESAGNCKQQVKEDDTELRILIEELQKKVGDYEKTTGENRTVEKLINQLALLEGKLNREIAAKKEMEKRLLDQTKKKSDTVKQELLRQITDQLSQQIDKQIKEAEMKVSNQTSVNLEKLKQEMVKVMTGQVNKQVERQVQESRKKIAEQLIPRTDAEMQKLTKQATDRMEQHFEKQLVDSEKKILEKINKKADMVRKEISKNITEQVSRQTEKKIPKTLVKTTSEESKKKAQLTKSELSQHTKENQSLQVEHRANETTKNVTHSTDKEIHESQRKTSSEFNQETEISKQYAENIVHQMGDVTDSRKQERFFNVFKELAIKVERQGLEVQNKMFAELQAKIKDLSTRIERQVQEQVFQTIEKQVQGIQKQCDALADEQIKRNVSEMKNLVTKSIFTEMGKQVAELQKMFAKEIKIQKQQLDQANQQFVNQLCNAQESAFSELKKTMERDKEDLQKLVEAKSSLHLKNNMAEFQKKMIEEFKTHKQELISATQKHVDQLQEMHDNASKLLSKKNEADKDKLLRSVDERAIQQSKVNETELQKRIAKELKHQKLELVQENLQFTTQLHDSQENALRQINKKVEVDKEKWMKYFEERLNQQMKSHLNALNKQMLQDKQELLQANQHSVNQLMGLQEISTSKFGKKLESQKQGLLSDFKNQLFEQLETRMTLFKNEARPQPQEDVTAIRNDLMEYVDKRVVEVHFEKTPAENAEITQADGAAINGEVPATVLDHVDFKRAIASEIESSLFEKLRGMMNGKCEKCSLPNPSTEGGDGGYVNENGQVLLQNSGCAVNGNSVDNEDSIDCGENLNEELPGDMSHFEHFEAMQRKIFNKQFGNLVNEAHAKIMAVVNELSGPKREKLVTEVTLRVNEELANMQKTLLGHIDAQIRIQTSEVLKHLEEKQADSIASATETNGNGNVQEGFGEAVVVGKKVSKDTTMAELDELSGRDVRDTQTTLMREWHEENSKLVQLPQGNLLNNVDHKEEIRRLIKEEMISTGGQEDGFGGSNDTATTYVWRITNFRKKFESLKTSRAKQIASGEFTVQETPLKLKAHCMRSKLAHWLSLVMGFVKADGLQENVAKTLYSHKRTFVLVDQSQGVRRRDRVIVREPGFRDEGVDKWMTRFYGPVCFAQMDALEEGSIYVKNDTLIIKIILEPTHTLYRSMCNDDGVLFWKIDNYGAKKQAEIDGLVECLYSDYFSTSSKGYRMQIRAYLNGDDQCESKHLSIYLYFRRGQHDEFIAYSFPHKVTFTVLGQGESGDCKDIAKTMESDGHILSAYGFREFALQSEIESPEYLKNDTLLIKVEVVPLMESGMSSLCN